MSTALALLAAEIGAPLIRDLLKGKIGGKNADLAVDAVKLIAEHAGGDPDDLERLVQQDRPRVVEAIKAAELATPEIVSLYASGLEQQFALLQAETREPLWVWAWRPLAMYGFGFLWIWNLVLLHVANAVFKIALPQTDLWLLFQLNSIYMALYMGGHTLKNVVSKWANK